MRRFLLLALLVAGCGGEPERRPPVEWTAQLAALARGGRTVVDLDGSELRPEDLYALGDGCEGLERILILNVPPTIDREANDAAWRAVLPKLPNLRRATFDGVVSVGVFAEGGRPPLTHLNLPSAGANSTGFRELIAGQPSLELLRLHAPRVEDRDLEALTALPNLRFLHLIGAPLTDAAVPHFAACETLESVYLDQARLTSEGWEELHRLRPDLHLHADLTHPVGGH